MSKKLESENFDPLVLKKESQVKSQICWRNKHPDSHQILFWSEGVDKDRLINRSEDKSTFFFYPEVENQPLSSPPVSKHLSHRTTTTVTFSEELK